ncbi:hypothetical protein Pint_10028 [Pistacia integerrima]|uniref:Uncharacterized protein n=1 Tax=Pistacia integerrima TaxID=434235 RepID=A0ACC0XI20_9ROSI|nr:hypothetical protein Pint_10028 [Pistacia integerrima]
MASLTLYFHILSLFLCFFFSSGGLLKMVTAQRTWCVANPTANISTLIGNLDYACNRIDCDLIQQGGSCFYPDTYIHHASFAMNMYYQAMGRHSWDCNFKDSGLISMTDPSYESCTFQSGGHQSDNGPTMAQNSDASATWCVAKPGTNNDMLLLNINYACNHVDCTPTHGGGACYNPATLLNHASFAMNLYFQSNGRNPSSCDFRKTGLIVTNDPSYGTCTYEYSGYRG